MPTVRFAANEHGPELAIDAPTGGALVDLCDDARAPVAFSCRSARCATCLVLVERGAELLDARGPDEAARLARTAAPSAARLACQARVRAGPGEITLRWTGAR